LAGKGLLDAALDYAASQSKRLARAKEQGFNTDTVYYHSTDKLEGDDLDLEGKEFTTLNPSTSGKLGPGVYASPTPAYTERYIRSASQAGDKQLGFGDNSRTLPIFVRGKIGDIKNYNSASDKAKGLLTKEFKEIDAASKNNEFDEIMAFRQKLALQKRKAQEVMVDDGFSGFQVSDEIVVFDPKNIRSVNAQFDPKNKDSSKILASAAPIAVGAGLLGLSGQSEAGPLKFLREGENLTQATERARLAWAISSDDKVAKAEYLELRRARDEQGDLAGNLLSEPDVSYRGSHQPSGPDNEYPVRLDDLTKTISGESGGYPTDFYSSDGPRLYAPGPRFSDDEYGLANKQSYIAAAKARGNPDAEVTMYRAVPNDKNITGINPGDFVTLSPKYAEIHAYSGYGPSGNDSGKVISEKVKVKDIYFAGDDVNEYGYFPDNKPNKEGGFATPLSIASTAGAGLLGNATMKYLEDKKKLGRAGAIAAATASGNAMAIPPGDLDLQGEKDRRRAGGRKYRRDNRPSKQLQEYAQGQIAPAIAEAAMGAGKGLLGTVDMITQAMAAPSPEAARVNPEAFQRQMQQYMESQSLPNQQNPNSIFSTQPMRSLLDQQIMEDAAERENVRRFGETIGGLLAPI